MKKALIFCFLILKAAGLFGQADSTYYAQKFKLLVQFGIGTNSITNKNYLKLSKDSLGIKESVYNNYNLGFSINYKRSFLEVNYSCIRNALQGDTVQNRLNSTGVEVFFKYRIIQKDIMSLSIGGFSGVSKYSYSIEKNEAIRSFSFNQKPNTYLINIPNDFSYGFSATLDLYTYKRTKLLDGISLNCQYEIINEKMITDNGFSTPFFSNGFIYNVVFRFRIDTHR